MKLPAIMFYPGDWLQDDVSGCSLAAQGLWLRMMFLMHNSDRYGYLSLNGSPIPPESVARRCGCDTLAQYETLLDELIKARVPEVTKEGIILSRRMVRDDKKRRDGSKYGRLGGNPSLKDTLKGGDKGLHEDETVIDMSSSDSLKPSEIVEAWNGAGFRKIELISAKRANHLTARVKSKFFVQNWRMALEKAKASDFCNGRKAVDRENPWIADFDWFIRSDDAVAKLIEGKYDNRQVLSKVVSTTESIHNMLLQAPKE